MKIILLILLALLLTSCVTSYHNYERRIHIQSIGLGSRIVIDEEGNAREASTTPPAELTVLKLSVL